MEVIDYVWYDRKRAPSSALRTSATYEFLYKSTGTKSIEVRFVPAHSDHIIRASIYQAHDGTVERYFTGAHPGHMY
jgi:hypothetical protein